MPRAPAAKAAPAKVAPKTAARAATTKAAPAKTAPARAARAPAAAKAAAVTPAKRAPAAKATKAAAKPARAAPAAKATAAKPTAKRAPRAKAAAEVAEGEEAATGKGNRCFKLLVNETIVQEGPAIDAEKFSKDGGRYKGDAPLKAAGRAFSQMCRNAGKPDHCVYIFTIKETTRGSKGASHTYIGTHHILDEPRVMQKGGTEFKIRFENTVRAYRPEKTEAAEAATDEAEEVEAEEAVDDETAVDGDDEGGDE